MTSVVYCHGFGSSPASKKASQLRAPLEAVGAAYVVPDLNVPTFETITLTAILHTLDQTLAPIDDRVILVGSSLGGLAALHYYDHYRHSSAARVSHLVLLAPVFDFDANRVWKDGTDWDTEWRTHGTLDFMNYTVGAMRPVHYGMVEDIRTYDSARVALDIPTLIIHGTHDDVVTPQQSIDFAAAHPSVTLHLVAGDHQLLDQTNLIQTELLRLLQASAPSN